MGTPESDAAAVPRDAPTEVIRANSGRRLDSLYRAWRAPPAGLLWVLPVLLSISVYYVFLASAGTFHDLPTQLDYYDQMCEGFRAGHLYVQLEPSQPLLAQADPFAYSNVDLWLWDATLYRGHYYLYWGPVPALFLLAFKVIAGTHERITDQWLTTLFMLGRLYAGSALILSLASRARIRQPAWICCLAIAVFGLANPSPFIVARPHVYEASLAGGQCFLFLGLVFAFWGIERSARREWFFLFAGISWALAIGCRVTTIACIPFLLAITAGFAWHNSRRVLRGLVLGCLALGGPVAAASVAYGIYNYVRFDSVTEFGVSYQLTLQPFFGNAAYVLPNVFSYLFAPVDWSCKFPFVSILGDRPLSPLLNWPAGYQSFERVAGIMRTAAWCWLAGLSVWHLAEYLATRRSRPRASLSASNLSLHESWAIGCSVASMLSMVPVLPLWEASMRYVEDALGAIVIVATLGAFWLLRRSYLARRRASGLLARSLIVVLGAQTCVVGAFSAFTSYYDPFKNQNPVLYGKLEAALSLCGRNTEASP